MSSVQAPKPDADFIAHAGLRVRKDWPRQIILIAAACVLVPLVIAKSVYKIVQFAPTAQRAPAKSGGDLAFCTGRFPQTWRRRGRFLYTF